MTERSPTGDGPEARPWSFEQVAAIAPTPRAVANAEPLASPGSWSGAGGDERALWGRCAGSAGEPYEVVVDHVGVAWRCSCPSRQRPCKHVLALLLMWVAGSVPDGPRPPAARVWLDRRVAGPDDDAAAGTSGAGGDDAPPAPGVTDDADGDTDDRSPAPPDRDELDRARDERVARMREGLAELDRWLVDRMRTGLADPALARYSTWDELAARLVDARAGSLANRVRRLAGMVGASPDWHERVLAEMGLLHLLATAGRRVPDLPGPLADAVATASGWQVRQADVLLTAPDTGLWWVAGRSDTREDRIEVRRWWLRNTAGEWAMLLSFAAYQQVLDESWQVGQSVDADLHRYPGRSLRAIVGERRDVLPMRAPDAGSDAVGSNIAEACDSIGSAIAHEPWLERYPAVVVAAPTFGDGRWVLADGTGSLPLDCDERALATLLAASSGSPVPVTIEWTPTGVAPLAVHLDDRTLDVGPVADPSFVQT